MAQTIKIVFDVDTADIDKATKKLDELAKAADKAAKAGSDIDRNLSRMERVIGIADKAAASFSKWEKVISKINDSFGDAADNAERLSKTPPPKPPTGGGQGGMAGLQNLALAASSGVDLSKITKEQALLRGEVMKTNQALLEQANAQAVANKQTGLSVEQQQVASESLFEASDRLSELQNNIAIGAMGVNDLARTLEIVNAELKNLNNAAEVDGDVIDDLANLTNKASKDAHILAQGFVELNNQADLLRDTTEDLGMHLNTLQDIERKSATVTMRYGEEGDNVADAIAQMRYEEEELYKEHLRSTEQTKDATNALKKEEDQTKQLTEAKKEGNEVTKEVTKGTVIDTESKLANTLAIVESIEADKDKIEALKQIADASDQANTDVKISVDSGDVVQAGQALVGLVGAARVAGGIWPLLKNTWNALRESGGLAEGIKFLASNLKFLASPTGIVIALGAAVAGLVTSVISLGEAVGEELKTARQEFGALGEDAGSLEILTTKANALTEIVGGDLRDNMEGIKNMLNSFGGSADEASNVIGMFYEQLGSEKAQEALEWANEYDTQLHKLGFTAQQMGNLLVNSIQAGVYDDKALDAVKEFGIRMNALTDGQKAMIANEAGLSKIFASINKGAISGKEGLLQVSDELARMQAQGKDITPIVSELFGGAGEDLGEAVLNLRAFTTGNVKLTDSLQKQLDTEKLLQQERVKTGASIWAVWKPIKNFFKELGGTIELYLYKAMNEVFSFFKPLGDLIVKVFNLVKDQMERSTGPMKILKQIWDAFVEVLYGAWNLIKGAFSTIIGLANVVISIIYSIAKTTINAIVAVYDWAMSFEVVRKAVGYLQIAWDLLYRGFMGSIRALGESLNAFGDLLSGLADAIALMAQGKFTQAWNRWVEGAEKAGQRMKEAFLSGFRLEKKDKIEDVVVTAPLTLGGGAAPTAAAKDTEDKRKRADEEAKARLQKQLTYQQNQIDIAEKKGLLKAEEAAVAKTNLEIEHNKEIENLAENLIVKEPTKWRKRNTEEERAYQIELLGIYHNRVMAIVDRENVWREHSKTLRDQDLADTQKATAEIEALYNMHYDQLRDLQTFFNTQNEYSAEVSAIKLAQIELQRYEKIRELNKRNKERELETANLTKEQIADINLKYANKEIELTKNTNKAIEETEKNHYALRKRLMQEFQQEALDSINKFGENLSSQADKQSLGSFTTALMGGLPSLVTGGITANQSRKKREADINTALQDPNISATEKKALQLQKVAGKVTMGIQLATQAMELLSKATDAYFANALANIDKEIEARNKEIEKIRETAEETKKLRKEDESRLELLRMIQNDLADNRIEELEHLRESVPEAQQKAVDMQIEEEKRKKNNETKLGKQGLSEEEKRIKALEEMNRVAELRKQKLQAEAFDIQKAAMIIQTISAGALGAIQAFASLAAIPVVGVGLGIAAAATVGVLTAVQVGLIASQPNPYRFNKGTLNVPGSGNEDTVQAYLTPGEAVIPKDINRDYSSTIKAIFNRNIPPEVLNSLIHNYSLHNPDMGGVVFINNNTETDKLLERLITTIERKESVAINIDEDGFDAWVSNANTRTKHIDKTLRRKV